MADQPDDRRDDPDRGRPRTGMDRALDLGREPREVRSPVPTEEAPRGRPPAEIRPFDIFLDLAENEWRTWDEAAGLGPLPRKLLAGTDRDCGWALRAAFETAVRTSGATPADLAIDGGGRYLHFTGRWAGADLTPGPGFTAVLAAYLGGVRGSRPDRAVVYHPGDGGWVRVGFATTADPPRSPAPAGRKPGEHEPFPAEAVAALVTLQPDDGTAADAVARLQPILDALAGKAAARADQARHVTARVNAVLDAAGLVLTCDGRPVRLSVVNLKTTAGSFRLRALGTKDPETLSTSRTFPKVTAVPRSPD